MEDDKKENKNTGAENPEDDMNEENLEINQGEKRKDPESLEERLAKAEQEAADNLAGWQRAKADFINYKKDQEQTMADFRKYANLNIITDLLPIVDSFNLAAKHMPPELEKSDWAKGIMCIKGMFDNFLRDAGISEIEALGKKFDPYSFEAVGEEESNQKEDTVIEEVQKGYKMGDRVIRPAKVKVAKNKE